MNRYTNVKLLSNPSDLSKRMVVAHSSKTTVPSKKKEMARIHFHEQYQIDLTTVHNVLRRAINQVILVGPTISPQDIPDFLVFCRATSYFLESHHTNEDLFVFPLWEKRGIKMESFSTEHQEIHSLVEEMSHLALSQQADDKTVARLVEVAREIKDVLFPHLDQEEEISTPKVMEQHNITKSDLDQMNKGIFSRVAKEDPFLVLPIIFFHVTPEEKKKFVQTNFPFLLRRILFPLIFSRKFKGAWRFSFKKYTKK